jgi:DNA-binding SARP family transcriptional activator
VRGGYAINRRHVRIDADEFEASAARGLAAIERGEASAGRELIGQALELYTGEFLTDEPYSEWAYEERNRLRGLVARCLRALATSAGEDPVVAADYLERLAQLEPFDAAVHRDLFAAWLAQGRRTEAARGYAAFRTRVVREFGEEPDFDLAALKPAA